MALQPRHVREHNGLGSAPFARHYSGYRSFLSFPPGTKMFQFPGFAPNSRWVTGLQPAGLPHSEIVGSKPVCSSPTLIAAYHVLRRLRIAKASSVRSYLLSLSCTGFSALPASAILPGVLTTQRLLRDPSVSVLGRTKNTAQQ